jgi:hypothetical protein
VSLFVALLGLERIQKSPPHLPNQFSRHVHVWQRAAAAAAEDRRQISSILLVISTCSMTTTTTLGAWDYISCEYLLRLARTALRGKTKASNRQQNDGDVRRGGGVIASLRYMRHQPVLSSLSLRTPSNHTCTVINMRQTLGSAALDSFSGRQRQRRRPMGIVVISKLLLLVFAQ